MNTIKEAEFDYESYAQENVPDSNQIQPAAKVLKSRQDALNSQLIDLVNLEIKHARKNRHVFISYSHENKSTVQHLCKEVASHDISVWIDWDELTLGTPWKQAINKTIQSGDFFVACFSQEYLDENRNYLQEDLSVAIEHLRQKPDDRAWFIPIKLNHCEIPDIKIGKNESIRDLKCVDLYSEWDNGVNDLLKLFPSRYPNAITYTNQQVDKQDQYVLFRSINGQCHFIPFNEVRWNSKTISLSISPNTSEQVAYLNSLRTKPPQLLTFAHLEDALWVKPKEVEQTSTKGKTVWKIILKADTTGKVFMNQNQKTKTEHLDSYQIAYIRTKRLLLNEKLEDAIKHIKQTNVFETMSLEMQIRGELPTQYKNRLQTLASPIPELYRRYKNSPNTFLTFSRLISVLYLKLSDSIDDILQLDFELLNTKEVKVKFRGKLNQHCQKEDSILVEFEGFCPLV